MRSIVLKYIQNNDDREQFSVIVIFQNTLMFDHGDKDRYSNIRNESSVTMQWYLSNWRESPNFEGALYST